MMSLKNIQQMKLSRGYLATKAPKPNGDIRMTLDARHINKAIQSSNLPIPCQEDIKAKLSATKIFSKLDFKNAFWQLEFHPD